MTKNVEVWQCQAGDTVYVSGESMTVKNIETEPTGVTMSFIDAKGLGHYKNFGRDDIIALELG
jgi:hypothetical protein